MIHDPTALAVHITALEMTAPPKTSLAAPVNIHTAIMSAPEIPLPFYRYLYRQIGERWHWVDRLRMSDEELAEIIHHEHNHICVLYMNGAPAGFFEYVLQDDDIIELTHFGVMEHALGLGIGKWFLLQALYAMWAQNPERIVTTTNNLDHPRALQLYQMFGFSPTSTSEGTVQPLTEQEWLKLAKSP